MALQFWSILTALVVRWRQRISRKCAKKFRVIVFLIKSVFLFNSLVSPSSSIHATIVLKIRRWFDGSSLPKNVPIERPMFYAIRYHFVKATLTQFAAWRAEKWWLSLAGCQGLTEGPNYVISGEHSSYREVTGVKRIFFFLGTRQCVLSLVGLIGSIFPILYIITCCSYSSASLSLLSS